jgi:hypothetical protein
MKIAITGTTQGLGQHLKQVFEQHGHKVLEFNRSNGYDIKQPQRIVDEAQDCDLFINNAYDGYGQVDLLYSLVDCWEKQNNKFIINIGSEQTRRWSNHHGNTIVPFDWREGQRSIQYRSHKLSLTEASNYLYQVTTWPQIMLVDIGMLDTQPAGYWSKHRTSRQPIQCEHAAKLIYNMFDQRELHFVSELVLRPLVWLNK